MLEFDRLRVGLGAFSLVVDAKVPRGQRLAILGASGSGKSTLLSAVAGFVAPDEGRVVWGGASLNETAPSKRPVSILFQDGNLFPHLSVAANVGLALRPDLRLRKEEAARVTQALDRVGLGAMGGRKPAELSGGQRSRAALARVLLQDRPVALLDEPFAALDPGLRAEMLSLLDELSAERDLTALLATHDLRDAERLCDRVWLLVQGRLVVDRAVAGLRDDPPEDLRDWL